MAEERLDNLKSSISKKLTEYTLKRQEYQDLVDKLKLERKRFSRERAVSLLQQDMAASEKESGDIMAQFMNKSCSIDDFTRKYLEWRTRYHLSESKLKLI